MTADLRLPQNIDEFKAGVYGLDDKQGFPMPEEEPDAGQKHQAHNSGERGSIYEKGKAVVLFNGKRHQRTVGAVSELEPLAQIEIPRNSGGIINANILARVHVAGDTDTFILVEKDGQFAGAKIDGNGTVKDKISMNDYGIGGHNLSLYNKVWQGCNVTRSKKPDADGYTWKFSPLNGEKGKQIILEVAADSQLKENPKSHLERSHIKEKWLRRGKKALAAVAIAMTLKSGGLADRASEGFVDTEATVVAAAAPHERYQAGETIDGVTLDEEMADEWNEQIDAENEKLRIPNEAVTRTMNDLDQHNYEAIQQRAQEYLDKNPGQLMDAQKVKELRNTIRNAATKDEITAALNELATFYGLQMEFGQFEYQDREVSVDTMRNTVGGIYDFLSKIPKSVIEKSQLSKIILTDYIDSYGMGTAVGMYDSYNNAIKIKYETNTGKIIRSSLMVPGSQPVMNSETTMAHEFSHALNMTGGINAGENKEFILDNGIASTGIDFVTGGILGYPLSMSTYARSDSLEGEAENLSGVMNDRRDGLAHPDKTRRFTSPANRAMLTGLINLEKAFPGSADYFVSINKQLMNKI